MRNSGHQSGLIQQPARTLTLTLKLDKASPTTFLTYMPLPWALTQAANKGN